MFWGHVAPKDSSAGAAQELRSNLSIVELPQEVVFGASVLNILEQDLGFLKSIETGEPALGGGDAIPMISYALVEYLMGLDLSRMEVFEFGGGGSTVFWSRRAKSVTTVENSPDWGERIKRLAIGATEVHVVAEGGMPAFFDDLDRSFDIIVIDCRENRFDCAGVARPRLRKGGMIILDNSEWYPNTSKYLRDSDLIEVDFHDFRPCHHHRCTASLYLDREFSPAARGRQLPAIPIGGKAITSGDWDRASN